MLVRIFFTASSAALRADGRRTALCLQPAPPPAEVLVASHDAGLKYAQDQVADHRQPVDVVAAPDRMGLNHRLACSYGRGDFGEDGARSPARPS
jgi:hypothetical protein